MKKMQIDLGMIEVKMGFKCLLFLIVSFTGSLSLTNTNQNLIFEAPISFEGVEQISPSSQKEDLDLVLRFLENGYGGKGILPTHQYEGLLRELRDLSRNSVTIISSRDFCNKIGRIIEKVNDFHLSVRLQNVSCERNWPKSNVGKNSGASEGNGTWTLLNKSKEGARFQILSIKQFTSRQSEEWNHFLNTVKILKDAKKPFVLDMRGNGGGDLSKGYEMAQILYGLGPNDKVPFPRKTIYRRRTPEAWALMANAFWIKSQKLHLQKKEVPSYLLNQFQEMRKYYDKSLNGLIDPMEIEEQGPQPFNPLNSFQEPLYVLIDRDCGSSCELTLEALESLPNVITVGENTGGVLQYGNLGGLYLKKSHLVLNIPTQGTVYHDGRIVEKVGYYPDIEVPSGMDALEVLMNNLKVSRVNE